MMQWFCTGKRKEGSPRSVKTPTSLFICFNSMGLLINVHGIMDSNAVTAWRGGRRIRKRRCIIIAMWWPVCINVCSVSGFELIELYICRFVLVFLCKMEHLWGDHLKKSKMSTHFPGSNGLKIKRSLRKHKTMNHRCWVYKAVYT